MYSIPSIRAPRVGASTHHHSPAERTTLTQLARSTGNARVPMSVVSANPHGVILWQRGDL